jgi:glycosyltransferase involved in cell wall biosynthesis
MGDNKVSVIMPTYKQDGLLHSAVESILHQTYKNIELIVVDDNEDESYKEKNRAFFQKLNSPLIKYIINEHNLGSAQSRNVGLMHSTGEYITFLDDDDVYTKDKIELQLERMLSNKADYSVTNIVLQNEDGVKDIRLRRYLYKGENLLVSHLKYHITATSTFMFRRDFLLEIGGFPKKDLGDEFYLMLNAIRSSNRFVHCDEVGVLALVHNQTGLSSCKNKIISENDLFQYKQKFFTILSKKDIRYIKMRHYAVKAVAYKKGNRVMNTLFYVLKSFMISPTGFLNLLLGKDR